MPCVFFFLILAVASPLCTSFVASCNHSFFKKSSQKMMHMLWSTKHVFINSCTFFKCTSTLFNKMLPVSIPNARSMHMRVEFWTKFQWYSFHVRPYLWPLYGANIHGRQGYATLPTKAYEKGLLASQYWPISVLAHRLTSCIDQAQYMSKSQKKHLLNTTPYKRIE